jgi:hypothetical protein
MLPDPVLGARFPRAKPRAWYTGGVTTSDTKRIERIARESADLARKTLKKTNELEAYLSLLDKKISA